MDDLPSFSEAADAATDAVDAVRDHGRTLLPWLPDPPTCDCGALMYATETFAPRQARYVRAWECRAADCDAPDRYREEPTDQPDVPQPRPLR